jgi:hypothetical protein
MAATSLMNSVRTGRWNTWDGGNDEPLTWFEGLTGSTAAITIITPLLVVIVRAYASK